MRASDELLTTQEARSFGSPDRFQIRPYS
jgi:hypothetical protein